MDHDGGFTAQDNVDTTLRRKPDQTRLGEDTMITSQGGIENREEREAEDTPLLREDDPYEYSKPPYQDWEHLPWWKTPSVSGILRV